MRELIIVPISGVISILVSIYLFFNLLKQEKGNQRMIEIAKAIQDLPEKRRIIFCMHRFEKLTYKEIAKIQGISIKTVETQIRRSLLFLEKQLSRFLHSIII